MPSSLARRVGRAIRIHGLWSDDDRLAVALSGGSDSVALLLLLGELLPTVPWKLCGVIHVHHGLRGIEADRDVEFCRELARRNGLPIEVVYVDVPAERATTGASLEAAARGLRYAGFNAAAGRLGATVVATGHTLEDQAETVLLRLFRGATSRGLGAIRPRRGMYARPLLDCRRAELRAHLARGGHSWREDESNADHQMPRNRLRHEVMPVVGRGWPGAAKALARFARTAVDDERWLSRLADAAARDVIRTAPDGVELIRAPLLLLPAALARRVVRSAIEQAGGTVALDDVDTIRRLCRGGRPGSKVTLHRLYAEVGEERLLLVRPTGVPEDVAFEHRLDVPGEVRIVETGGVVRASFVEGADRPALSEGWDAVAVLRASAVSLPLTVRSRRAGDRFRPLGAPGRRTLQNLFVDRRVPRHERSRVPVVVDAGGHIVWVAAVAVAESCRVRAGESGMLILEVKKGTQ